MVRARWALVALCLLVSAACGSEGYDKGEDKIAGFNVLIAARQGSRGQAAPHRVRRQGDVPDTADVYWLHVDSRVTSRFATVTVESKLANRADRGREAVFTMQLPEAAFISNFSMVINDTLYVGSVMERGAAREAYDAAVEAGESAGHVAQELSPRGREVFQIAINVGAEEKVTFQLTYQEFLVRRLGIYEHVISIRPAQIIPNMRISVDLREPQGFSFLRVPDIRTSDLLTDQSTDELSTAAVSRVSPEHYTVIYAPSEQEQTAMSAEGIMGDFVVQYDVIRQEQIGFIQVYGDYFVHYFAPTGLPVMPKSVIFVIDVSGSMGGDKIRQTKEAMAVILDELRGLDFFNIVTFSDRTTRWRPELQVANQANVKGADTYVNNMIATGGTNINDAIIEASALLDQVLRHDSRASMIVLLTDGQPTIGVTNTNQIIANARDHLAGNPALFCLGFGYDVSFEFLERLALQNGGFARRIYTGTDGELQLTSFFDEVAKPLMIDVNLGYGQGGSSAPQVADVTQTAFSNYFNGSEVVVTVRFPGAPPSNFHVTVTGKGAQDALSLVEDFQLASLAAPEGFVERLWAYLTIKDLLKKERTATEEEQQSRLKERALNMSLEYNFVTPLTSMVVLQNDRQTQSADRASGDDAGLRYYVKTSSYSGASSVRSWPFWLVASAVVLALLPT
ncbi:ITIH4 [Branchiostoma lanceolatum]|uniref:ITIH4 protein n=2 Tax=Branchiostoma lanceolatum TaxID=7740 RepID=A0A8K0AFL5_BRALA|nr:ITIH4 [Branchiostoma lanceolatum]